MEVVCGATPFHVAPGFEEIVLDLQEGKHPCQVDSRSASTDDTDFSLKKGVHFRGTSGVLVFYREEASRSHHS